MKQWYKFLDQNYYWAVLVIILLYLIPQILLLAKPGMQQDEAVFIVPSMELAYGKPITYGYSVNLFGIYYPTMLGGYTGNSLTLPVAAVIHFFGVNPVLIRLIWVLVGVGVIFFTFLVCRELFNTQVGLLAAFLLTINPGFWVFSKVGGHASANMTLDIMASLYFFLYFYRTRQRRWLFLAMYFTGHGLYTKLAFGYFLLAYLIAFGYLWFRGRLKSGIFNIPNLLVSSVAFLLGSWPLIYHLLSNSRSTTTGSLTAALGGTSVVGQSNMQIWHNLLLRIEQMQLFLEGRLPIDSIVPGVIVAHNLVMPYVFVAMLAFLILAVIWPGRRLLVKEAIIFIILTFCLFQVLIIFTPSTLNQGVFVFIPPFIAIILALSFYLLIETTKRSGYPWGQWLALGGIVFFVYTESSTLAFQYEAIRQTGGRGFWSSTINKLTEYLLQNPNLTPIALDWGLDHPVYVLSDSKIKPETLYMPSITENGILKVIFDAPASEFEKTMESQIYLPRNVYLVRDESFAAFKKRLAVLEQVVAANGGKLVKIHSINESDGQEFIKVYAVQWPVEPRPDELSADSPLSKAYPQITTLYPDRSFVGAKFNEQPNGQAAIGVKGQGFDVSSIIYFNDEPLQTNYTDGLVTALVPDKFINSVGEIKVFVVNRGRFKSNTLTLEIMPE